GFTLLIFEEDVPPDRRSRRSDHRWTNRIQAANCHGRDGPRACVVRSKRSISRLQHWQQPFERAASVSLLLLSSVFALAELNWFERKLCGLCRALHRTCAPLDVCRGDASFPL